MNPAKALHLKTLHEGTYVAIDPATGRHLRPATASERAAYIEANRDTLLAFDRPVRLQDVTVDRYTGPGAHHWPVR